MTSQNNDREPVSRNEIVRPFGASEDRYGRVFQFGTHKIRTIIRGRQVLFVYADFHRSVYKDLSGVSTCISRLTPEQKSFSDLAISHGVGENGRCNVLTEDGLRRAAFKVHHKGDLKAFVANEMLPYARDIAKGVPEAMAGLDWPFRGETVTEIPAFLPSQALAPTPVPMIKIEGRNLDKSIDPKKPAEVAPTLSATAAIDPTQSPVVRERDGRLWVDSRDVAAAFGKQHKDVLKAIRNLECSQDFTRRNFAPFKIKDLTGETTSHVEMTRDGFAFLAMGFTGAKAAAFKEAYINRFDAMERELQQRAAPRVDFVVLLNDPAALRGILSGYVDRVIALEEKVQVLEPRSAVLDEIAATPGSISMMDAAKTMGIRPSKFPAWLVSLGWIFRRGKRWSAHQAKIDAGFLVHKVVRHFAKSEAEAVVQVRITPAGMVKLALLAQPNGRKN